MRVTSLLALLLLFSMPAMAEIYQCQPAPGVIEFTDVPCTGPGEKITNIEERYTSDLPGLRPYELERLQQLEQNLRLEKLARIDARQAIAALTASDEVLCRSALFHLENMDYRVRTGYVAYNNRYFRELLDTQIQKREKYCY